jgi:outer membrane protein assembly factor BamB
VIWDTPAGKQVVTPGMGKMIAYDLKTGEEKWHVNGMPAGPCSSPVAADGLLLYAGWTPGDAADTDFKMPTFDDLLKLLDGDKDGALTRLEVAKSELKDFFDNQDQNSDGKLTRDEWDAMLKFMGSGVNSAFAVRPGGAGDVGKSHVAWKKKKGLPYVASPLAYRGLYVCVKDGGIVTAFDIKTGKEVYLQERVAAAGSYYASPVAANGHIYTVSLQDGTFTVLKAGPKAEVAATNPSLGERVSATPAIADDTLYVRTARHLYAFAEK